ncbi:MAG: hypothetical protein QM784_36695 [Polyangiaceae bacterium]
MKKECLSTNLCFDCHTITEIYDYLRVLYARIGTSSTVTSAASA